jgi:hypothetical protein
VRLPRGGRYVQSHGTCGWAYAWRPLSTDFPEMWKLLLQPHSLNPRISLSLPKPKTAGIYISRTLSTSLLAALFGLSQGPARLRGSSRVGVWLEGEVFARYLTGRSTYNDFASHPQFQQNRRPTIFIGHTPLSYFFVAMCLSTLFQATSPPAAPARNSRTTIHVAVVQSYPFDHDIDINPHG